MDGWLARVRNWTISKIEPAITRLPPKVHFAIQRCRAGGRLLDLDDCGLTEIPDEVYTLGNLTSINLAHNSLRTIPSRLTTLSKLQYVNLVGNPVEAMIDLPGLSIDSATFLRCQPQIDVTKVQLRFGVDSSDDDLHAVELGALHGLRKLQIGDWANVNSVGQVPNEATQKVIDAIGHLRDLDVLALTGLQLETLPESISQLSQLKTLWIGNLGLKAIPSWIGRLDLKNFGAWEGNRLRTLPDSFAKLRRLESLVISGNLLERIPASVFELVSLKSLCIYNCQIREIPAEVLRLPNLTELLCDDNPIESPPAEVVDKGLDSIRDYWRQRADTGVDYLCEAKLIILGEPGAGKTSLARKIENSKYQLRDDEESTEGIDVLHYEFPTVLRTREGEVEKALERRFHVNIWDFGGQEIYHATHQFFLTRRSVYVLVCDDRKEDTDFSYWLQAVEMLTDGSPLWIVQNEKQDRKRDINLSSLRARFTNLRGAMATNLDTDRGLDDVIKSIRQELEHLPHVGVGLPATWKRVREALEQDPRDYISLEEYLAICQQHGFTRREDKLQLSGYLHDLGICLHFQDDGILKNTVVLKPSWGTAAVYRVLDDPAVIAARGRFTRADLERIWSEKKYEGMQDELLQLMMKFKLCYALESGQAFIAPQRLSSERPSYPWDPADSVVVRYEYEFLPKGIVTRLIVALHRLIAGDNLVWKAGVVLERNGSRAEILEEYFQRRIWVRVTGPAPYGLLSIVDEQLMQLHGSFPRLKFERYLPCPCEECRGKAEPGSFALENLLKMANKGKEIQCHTSGEMVDAAELVRQVLPGAIPPQPHCVEPPALESISPIPAPLSTPEVLVSYAWNEASDAIVDRIQAALAEHSIPLIRDRDEMRYKDSIRDFMRRIGRGKCVVVVISEKYLKSANCMYELVQVAKEQSIRERIFPIVLPDANIYDPAHRADYLLYWETKINELNERLKPLRGDNLKELQQELTDFVEIRTFFDGIAGTLKDMNALTPDQHEATAFDELTRRVRAQLV